MNKLIILDRDGVINEDSDAYIKTVDEWVPIPGSIKAIARLSQAGYTVVVATNQSGIGRGYYDVATLDAMHARMRELVAAQGGEMGGIFYCPHGPDDGCDCRKPLPGLIDQIVTEYGDVTGAPLIGDSLRDLQAGIARHCQPVLVLTGKGQKTLDKGLPENLGDVAIFDSLADFVDHTLKD
ncbi:D,D-heptose 1,7-bisphosphate phosphatase [Alcanivorax sp. P2S70]|uniref:D,D-heptose 1,7-bisphosphate phosphatase n=1 Tax=Alcanivorax profundi TaxID=2338368 RepID=A0A418XZQ9_9GAMM|nr:MULTISPECIES: D-glycero-beta-D-manno-heptose 1,7-bisphosphate 7-phosphatase [Alcanivorax]ERP89472.1 D,D-heptose 1,7-bisphosphate phosphatase [Alcanivorax sp. P2S70]RJG18515.1 D-glycero-beta-D-manno-heptose 1,7-bisphosphate 7-phosphatase [Alcanivorax profundi]|tara:strand:- start:496 stop:1038 length:543 start_codon:yes stop_codon:yes gene_type:complete